MATKKRKKTTDEHVYFRMPKKTIVAGIIMSVALGVVAAGILKMRKDAKRKQPEGKESSNE